MTESLPEDKHTEGPVIHDNETDEDSFGGYCIETGRVLGLDVKSADGGDRCGELVVGSVDGKPHTFAIRAAHQILILEDMYTLIGDMWQHHWAVGQ